MKPRIKLATTQTPDGGELGLYNHDGDFLIMVNGQELMSSRRYESEKELARLGCAHLKKRKTPRILIGGLGMGYTLRQTLDLLGPDAKVVVSELLPAVVDWNREHLGELNAQPLEDKRTEIITGDIFPLLTSSANSFDAILLDVDNGPSAVTDEGNNHLYSPAGIEICRQALRKPGLLGIWSAEPSKEFEQLLMSCNFHVRRYRIPLYKETHTRHAYIFIATEDKNILPPGGGELRIPKRKKSKGKGKYNWRKR